MKIDGLEGREGSDVSLSGIIDSSQTRPLPEGSRFQEDELEDFEYMAREKVRSVSYFGMVM